MCGRLNLQATQLTQLLLSILQQTYPGEDDYNTAPTQTLPVIRSRADGRLATPWSSGRRPGCDFARAQL